MRSLENHLTDRQLILLADGELGSFERESARAHLAACRVCRTRRQELDGAIADFVHDYRRAPDRHLPSPDGPRALLRARIEQMEAQGNGARFFHLPRPFLRWSLGIGLVTAAAILAFAVLPGSTQQHVRAATVTVPNPRLTPGAAVLVGRDQVCRAPGPGNKRVSRDLQRAVFEEYGIRAAEPDAYEVDYLITPALGGADDIHNLWPESSRSTVWNAQVKDALEDHLRDLVCGGQLDLATAQRDIANNWIEAYKKYFQTDQPIHSPDQLRRQP